MIGRILMTGLIFTALAIGAGIWYSSMVASYDQVDGVDTVLVDGVPQPVTNYEGLDGASSPLKLRACFESDWTFEVREVPQDDVTALVTPGWFECFDSEQINEDVRSGAAKVVISEENDPFGFTAYIALYPDGRGFMWRQINECGAAQFAGQALPAGCPGAQVPQDAIMALTLSGGFEPLLTVDGSVRGAGSFACFETPMSLALVSETFEIAEAELAGLDAAPACFPRTLADDAVNGPALVLTGSDDNQLIALYPDGRGFVWATE